MIEVRTVVPGEAGMRDFFELPYRLYRDDPLWIPPPRLMLRPKFDPRRGPFLRRAACTFLTVYRDGCPVGRVTAHVDDEHNRVHGVRDGFFGFFEAEEDEEAGRALVAAAEQDLRRRGCGCVRGPFNFTINDECGFQTSGFDRAPVIMMPRTKPYYPAWFERMGYETAQVLHWQTLEGVSEVPGLIRRAAARVAQREPEVTIRTVTHRSLWRDVRSILDIYNSAWSENWGYAPMTEPEMEAMTRDLRWFADLRFLYLASLHGEDVACLVALPDLNACLRHGRNGRLTPRLVWSLLFGRSCIDRLRIVLIGVKKAFRGRGFDVLLYDRCFRDGLGSGRYRHADFAWMLESNHWTLSMARKMGAQPAARYVLVERALPGAS